MRNFLILIGLIFNSTLSVISQTECGCAVNEVEIEIEYLQSICNNGSGDYYCDSSPWTSTWEIYDENQNLIVSGNYSYNNSICINKDSYLTVNGYDSDSGGCTDQDACNYQDSATQDDGTCEYCSCIITEPIIDLSSYEYASVLLNSNGIVDYYSFDSNGNDMTGLETISHPDINDRFIQVDMHGGNDQFVVCGLTDENTIKIWGSYNPVIQEGFSSIFSSSYGYSKVILNSSALSIMALNEFGGLEGYSSSGSYQNINPLPPAVAFDIVDFDFEANYVAALTSNGEIWVWSIQGYEVSTADLCLQFEPNTVSSVDMSSGGHLAILFTDGTAEVGVCGTEPSQISIPSFDDVIDIQAVYNGVFTLRENGQLNYWGDGSETTFNQIPDALFLNFTAKHDRISAIDVEGNIYYWGGWDGSAPFDSYPHPSYINLNNYFTCVDCIDEDQDNICDDIDDCVGEIDLCGVCNGPGVTYQCGCDPIPEGACDCFGNLIDECGICGGDGSSCVQTCLDDDDSVSAVGGCVNAVAVLGCSFYWNDVLISDWCPQSCNSCPCENDFNENGVCDENEVFGCAYIDAINYDSFVTTDNGSCVFELVSSNCPADIDGDGFVATTDLLMFLSSFGEDCE